MVQKKVTVKDEFLSAFNDFYGSYPNITKCIVSSVGDFSAEALTVLQNNFSVLKVTHKTKVPFKNLYATPQTLGVDRIALVAAAAITFPKKNILVIDAGSCVTYDFLSDQNEYLGGVISPGLRMRFKAMHTFTVGLPLLTLEIPKKDIGDSTSKAMQVGAFLGLVNEIDGFITSYSENYADLTVILTGGDAEILRDRLKNDIFANSNFLLEGLHYILEYNKD